MSHEVDELDAYSRRVPVRIGRVDPEHAREIERLFRTRAERLGYGYDVGCSYDFTRSICASDRCTCSMINMKIINL